MLSWLHKTAKISHKYAESPMHFKVLHSVIYWFVPIMNLYKPFQVMREVWDVSFGNSDIDSSDDRLSSFGSWKFSYQFNILVIVLIQVARRLETFPETYASYLVSMVILSCTGLLWIFCTRDFVKTLSKQQQLKWSLS